MSNSGLLFPTFPAMAFTGLFAKHLAVFGPTTVSPDPFQWAAMASSLSFLVGRDTVCPSGGGLFPNINVALVGDTSTYKSTPLDDTNNLVTRRFLPTPTAESSPSMFLFDGSGSGEGFIQALADTPSASGIIVPRRALVTFHELAEVFAKIRRDQAGNLGQVLLGSFDAHPLITHVTRKEILRVTNGLLLFQCASTFETLAGALSAATNTSGFINRFAWFGGVSTRRLARRPPVDQSLLKELLVDLTAILAFVHNKEMTITPEADALHEQWDAFNNARPSSEGLRLATKRANVYAQKFSALSAIANKRLTIIPEDIQIGWSVVEYNRFFAGQLVDMIPVAAFGELEDRLFEKACELAALSSDGTFTQSQVFQRLKSKRLGWHEIDRAFKAVIKRGDIALNDGTSRYRIVAKPQSPVAGSPIPTLASSMAPSSPETPEPIQPTPLPATPFAPAVPLPSWASTVAAPFFLPVPPSDSSAPLPPLPFAPAVPPPLDGSAAGSTSFVPALPPAWPAPPSPVPSPMPPSSPTPSVPDWGTPGTSPEASE